MNNMISIIRKILLVIVGNLIAVIIIFLIFEGFSSSMAIYDKIKSASILSERRHTQYDEEIGWINLPNMYIKDLYGPGRYLATNSQMFRNENDFSKRIPADKVRIICSGDSYTLGYGVSNDNTWCHLLSTIDNKIETVNMGQGGYGIDQAYLWYMRNSKELDHDIHILAFITSDFKRMLTDNFRGYGKPYLKLQDDVLVNQNRPVPERSYLIPKLTILQRELGNLYTVKLLRQWFPSLRAGTTDANQYDEVRKVSSKIFKNLYEINRSKDSILVLVHLPTSWDYGGTDSESWQLFLRNEAKQNNWILIDLIEEFRKYPRKTFMSMYRGHFNETGNANVADILYKKLIAVPEISERLNKK